jgi:hypothetical protein
VTHEPCGHPHLRPRTHTDVVIIDGGCRTQVRSSFSEPSLAATTALGCHHPVHEFVSPHFDQLMLLEPPSTPTTRVSSDGILWAHIASSPVCQADATVSPSRDTLELPRLLCARDGPLAPPPLVLPRNRSPSTLARPPSRNTLTLPHNSRRHRIDHIIHIIRIMRPITQPRHDRQVLPMSHTPFLSHLHQPHHSAPVHSHGLPHTTSRGHHLPHIVEVALPSSSTRLTNDASPRHVSGGPRFAFFNLPRD